MCLAVSQAVEGWGQGGGSLSWNSSPGLECSGECVAGGLVGQEGKRVQVCVQHL